MTRFILLFVLFCALANGVFVPPRPGHKKHHLLGEKECTYGPSFWCQNLTAAAGCHATKHCIQTVWIHKQLPPDTTSICDTCKDMVKQARDQLESNETQELIKEVFEGSCDLLKLKPIVKECDKIADEYIPDLIDTLASEMNPQVVCSVAGLCNSARVQQLLIESGELKSDLATTTDDRCNSCNKVMSVVVKNFDSMSEDDVLHSFLRVCRKLGSYSDACSNLVITHFEDIYSYLQNNLNANDVCLLSGECFRNFHKHEIEITPMSKIGYVPVESQKDEMVCDFCKQLVSHVRDEMVANTTEIEFKKVLMGLCKQTGSFSNECLSLVDQYYAEVYDFLVNTLNPKEVCDAVGLCNNNSEVQGNYIVPLLTPENAKKVETSSVNKLARVKLSKNPSSVKIINPVQRPEDMQLPIDLLMPPHTQLVYNKELCVFCEYFLHYVQEQITNPTTEDKIKDVLDKACQKLPPSVNATCVGFVDTYEPALVALLAQEIDPSEVCPLIKACPSSKVKDVDIFIQNAQSSAECPLCLYAITELESLVKDKKSQEEIKEALQKVCNRLPSNLLDECKVFVDAYTDKIVEAIIANLKPQEICVYLKLCTDTREDTPISVEMIGGDIETNLIPDDTINGQSVKGNVGSVQCVLCEFIMKEIDNQLKDKTTDDDIKNVVRSICSIMPGTVKNQCDDFMDKYADAIIVLLQEALEPKQICSMMQLCSIPSTSFDNMKIEIVECAVCEAAVTAMEKILSNPKVDHDIEHVLEKTCRGLPKHYQSRCQTLIEDYGTIAFDLLRHYTNKELVCQKIGYCKSTAYRLVGLI